MVTRTNPIVNGGRSSILTWQRDLLEAARNYAGENRDCEVTMRDSSFDAVDREQWVAAEKSAATASLEIAAKYPGEAR